MIAGFDKGNGGFMENLDCAVEKQTETLHECSKWEELLGYSIGIAHIHDDKWNSLCSRAVAKQILLRVSSVGFYSCPAPHCNSAGAYILHLRPPTSGISRDDWQRILEILHQPANVANLMSGCIDTPHWEYFTQCSTAALSALAILCQGYLAVQATPLPEENDDSHKFWKALARMGWTEFMKRPESKVVCQDLTEQKEKVRKQAWWREAIAGTQADAKRQLCNELRQDRLPAELESLIGEIIPDESQADIKEEMETVKLTTVSAAYLVLADRLEALV